MVEAETSRPSLEDPFMKSILVTGGAGYIGSHMVHALSRAGYRTVVVDNLREGHRYAARHGDLIEEDLNDRGVVRAIVRRHRPSAIFHFAAFCSVKESVDDPLKYYKNNVIGTMNLVEAALEVGVPRLIFSSTAALYGEPREVPITENHPLEPINPYGWSKLMGERLLADAAIAYGIRYVSFRYFNAAGADPLAGLGEDHRPETHLIPLALAAAMLPDRELEVYGTDYDTPDGSCIRDYVHVMDLVDAHLRGLQYLEEGGESVVLNLGTESGTSVLEIVKAVENVTGLPVPYRERPRRSGDPAVLVASNRKAKGVLGWEPKRDLEEIIRSAYEFHRRFPEGFPDVDPTEEFGQPQPQPQRVDAD
jgi:UDP-glucose-4-epimerase GalE